MDTQQATLQFFIRQSSARYELVRLVPTGRRSHERTFEEF